MTDQGYPRTDPHSSRRPTRSLRPDWRWMMALGVLLVLGGVLAFLNPFAASLAVVSIAGIVLLIGGALQLWIAFSGDGSTGGRAASGLLGLLAVVFGVFLLADPLAGIVSLTLLVAGFFLVMGVVRAAIGLALRPRRGWGWLVGAGAISVLLGVLIALAVPQSGSTLLGLFIGIDLLSTGISAIAVALYTRTH